MNRIGTENKFTGQSSNLQGANVPGKTMKHGLNSSAPAVTQETRMKLLGFCLAQFWTRWPIGE